jgi:hypothetical protein
MGKLETRTFLAEEIVCYSIVRIVVGVKVDDAGIIAVEISALVVSNKSFQFIRRSLRVSMNSEGNPRLFRLDDHLTIGGRLG